MNELIAKIEETVSYLLQYDMVHYGSSAQELAGMMIAGFPSIIDYYNDPKMSDIREDAMYWPGQLQRIIDAFGNGDYFEVMDVLYNETRPNLIELKSILETRGI